MRKLIFGPSLLGLSLIATPGFAQTEQSAPSATTSLDPNEKICQNVTSIGSRLSKKRICATRAEWEERNRLDREAVSQAQKQIGGPCTTVSNKNVGAPSC
jgi:hypothetical protein